MEGLTRLVAESLARHGFDRPLDYRRLHWSRWFRCESPHSLLFVPSKPGVFALAEEIMDLDRPEAESRKPEAESRRMLAVTQFFEADDMAFVLDRMLSRPNPMQPRLASGRYFVRFVVIEDSSQRRSISSALNQWMVSAAEKATGIGSHFATSLELTEGKESGMPHFSPTLQEVGASAAPFEDSSPSSPNTSSERLMAAAGRAGTLAHNSGAATNLHCPAPFPSGF